MIINRVFAASLFLGLVPVAASAHLASTGLGPVYDGAWHFLLTPQQGLPIAALALFAGLRGPARSRRLFFTLPVSWTIVALSTIKPMPAVSPLLGALAMLGAGAVLATAVDLSLAAVTVLGLIAGAVLSACYDGPPGVLPMFGALASILVLIPLAGSVALPLRRLEAIIAVRVAGSWTAALGLLLAGWWAHGRGQ